MYVSKTQTRPNRPNAPVDGYASLRPRVSACNTDLPTMLHVAELLRQFGPTSLPIKNQIGNRKPVHHAILTSWPSCTAICEALLPFLRTKRERAEILVAWGHDRMGRMATHGKYAVGFTDYDHDQYERLRALNSRGL